MTGRKKGPERKKSTSFLEHLPFSDEIHRSQTLSHERPSTMFDNVRLFGAKVYEYLIGGTLYIPISSRRVSFVMSSCHWKSVPWPKYDTEQWMYITPAFTQH